MTQRCWCTFDRFRVMCVPSFSSIMGCPQGFYLSSQRVRIGHGHSVSDVFDSTWCRFRATSTPYDLVDANVCSRHQWVDYVLRRCVGYHDQQEESNMIMIILVRNRDNMIYNFSMVIPHFLWASSSVRRNHIAMISPHHTTSSQKMSNHHWEIIKCQITTAYQTTNRKQNDADTGYDVANYTAYLTCQFWTSADTS